MIGFDRLITPKIIVFIYALANFALIVSYLVTSYERGFSAEATAYVIGGLIGLRVLTEVIIVSFKNNEYLRRISESLEEKK